MNLLDRKRISRDLSGPAASVLMALMLSGGAVTAVELERDWLDLSENTISKGLHILARHGLVTHYGRFEGWALNHTQLQLWQEHSGVLLSENSTISSTDGFVESVQKATIYQIQSEFVALTDPIKGALVDNSVDNKTSNCGFETAEVEDKTSNCGFVSHTRGRDQIRSDFKQSDLKDFDFKSDQIRQLIELLKIRPPYSKALIDGKADPVVFYGWYLWASEQPWIISAAGWAVTCTLKGSRPEAAWLRTAKEKLESGDLNTTKSGTCPECGEAINKDGRCYFCTGIIQR